MGPPPPSPPPYESTPNCCMNKVTPGYQCATDTKNNMNSKVCLESMAK